MDHLKNFRIYALLRARTDRDSIECFSLKPLAIFNEFFQFLGAHSLNLSECAWNVRVLVRFYCLL